MVKKFINLIVSAFGWKRCAMRSAMVFLGVAIGESVPRFDIVMSLIGGSLTGPLVFVLPPLMYARARALKLQCSTRSADLEVFSPSERRLETELINDPRIHSQSTYYGFPADNNKRHRYSYVYYDDDDDSTGLLSEIDEETTSDERAIADELRLRELDTEPRPVLVEASRPETTRKITKIRRIDIAQGVNERFDFHRLIDWFGYFVVFLGIIITLSSTYINIKNTIRFVTFTPPCIINASIAANVLSLA